MKASYPLGSHLGLVGYEEIFFNLNGARSGFDQNRLFAGLAVPLGTPANAVFEIGYLNQFIRAGTGDDRMNHIPSLQLLLSF